MREERGERREESGEERRAHAISWHVRRVVCQVLLLGRVLRQVIKLLGGVPGRVRVAGRAVAVLPESCARAAARRVAKAQRVARNLPPLLRFKATAAQNSHAPFAWW